MTDQSQTTDCNRTPAPFRPKDSNADEWYIWLSWTWRRRKERDYVATREAADELRAAREALREIEERAGFDRGAEWCRERARSFRLGR